MRLRKSDGEERGTEENEEKGTAREKGTEENEEMRKRDGGKFSLLRKGDGPCLLLYYLFLVLYYKVRPLFSKVRIFLRPFFSPSLFSRRPLFLVFLRPPFSRRRFFSVIILKFKGLVVYGYCEGYRFGFCFYNCYKYG